MKTTFDPDSHIATVDGEEWPSVTQLLSEFGLQDFSGVDEARLEYKRILGTRVHLATVMVDNGRLDEEHFNTTFPECVPYLDAYRKFRVCEKFEPVLKEYRLFSKKYKFHGAMDELAISEKYTDRYVLIDYKCTWELYRSCGPQLALYEVLIKENWKELGLDKNLIKKKMVKLGLNLKPSGAYDFMEFNDPTDLTDAMSCVQLHWALRNKYKTRKGVTKK